MEWRWDHFSKTELSCRHCGELYIDETSLDALERLRMRWGRPIILTSGHRCIEHNRRVGGALNSEHLKLAFDCVCPKQEQPAFVQAAQEAGFKGIGLYPESGFVHLDMGRKRSWQGR